MRIIAVLLPIYLMCCGVLQAAEPGRPGLDGVRNWLLLLNNDLDTPVVAQIAASGHDMVVIDHVSSQPGVPVERSADVVSRLRTMGDGRRRLVIAYLNIGQAESYRTYWKKGWRIGNPGWILGTDPDGWQDNYPVAYWRSDWKALITGPGGLMESLREAGFDGVYLDWVGGFEDDRVIAAGKRDGVDPRAEMIRWVREVSTAAKATDPRFIVIAQNAAPLLGDASYLAAIDAVAHEDIWFTGADNGPDGDCPVPRTAAEVGSEAHVSSLSIACRRAYLRDGANAMHFAGESEIVPWLVRARAAGKAVFTVDYALKAANVTEIRTRSRALGFVPFAAARPLRAYVEPDVGGPGSVPEGYPRP